MVDHGDLRPYKKLDIDECLYLEVNPSPCAASAFPCKDEIEPSATCYWLWLRLPPY